METEKPKSEPIRETAQADKQKAAPQADVATAAPLVKGEADESNPAESYDETDRKQDETLDSIADQTKWIKAQTLVAIVLGALTLGVLVYHGIMMGGQWEAMQDTLREMRISRELENRAWVGVKDMELVEMPTKEVAVMVTYVNSGNTPAHVTVTFKGDFLEQSPPDDFVFPQLDNKASILVLFPNVEYKGRIAVYPNGVPVLGNPKTSDHAYYIYGLLEYSDIFGRRHTTKFCYRTQVAVAGGKNAVVIQVAPTHNTFD